MISVKKGSFYFCSHISIVGGTMISRRGEEGDSDMKRLGMLVILPVDIN